MKPATPTEKQTRQLRVLTNGIVLAPGRREWSPLLRRGWVAQIIEDDAAKRYLPPLTLTPAGFHALARGIEKHDLALTKDDIKPGREQLDEMPEVTRLKGRLAETEEAKTTAEREAQRLRFKLGRVREAVSDV